MTTREEAFAYLLNAYESHGRYLDKRTKTADWISKPSQKARTWIRTTCTCLSLWLNLNAGPLAGKYYSWATIGQRGGYPASSARAISNLRKFNPVFPYCANDHQQLVLYGAEGMQKYRHLSILLWIRPG